MRTILNDDSGGWCLITYPARGRTCSPGPEILALGLYCRALGKRKHSSEQSRNWSSLSRSLAGPVRGRRRGRESLHGVGP